MNGNGHRRPEEIQAGIERTRTDLNDTLSAIERRLSPNELVGQGIDYLRHSGAREYVTNLLAAAKQDPIPLALVGVGLAWLMLSNGRSRQAAATTATTPSHGSEAVAGIKQKVTATAQRISETAHAASARAKEVGDSARQQVDRLRGGYDYLVHEQPLALGAIGLALGAVLAGVAPRTRQEHELLGDASNKLEADLKEAGQAQLDKAKRAATAAKDAVRDSPEHEGSPDASGTAPAASKPPDPVKAKPAVDLQTP